MIDKLYRALEARASGRNILVAGVVYLALATILNMGGAELDRLAGGPVLDLRHYFTADEAYTVLGLYGAEGRKLYLRLELVDLVYPLAYGSLFALGMTFLFKRLLAPSSGLHRLSLLPAATVVMDYLENIGIITMCATYPERWPTLGAAAGIFNLAKGLLAAACIALTAAGLVGWLAKSLSRLKRA